MPRNRTVYGNQHLKVRKLKQVRDGTTYWSAEWHGCRKYRGKRYYFPLGTDPKEAMRKWGSIMRDISNPGIPFQSVLIKYKRGYTPGSATPVQNRRIDEDDRTIGDHLDFVWANRSALNVQPDYLRNYGSCLIRIVGVGLAWQAGEEDATAMLTQRQIDNLKKKPLSLLDLLLVEAYKQATLDSADEEGRSEKSAKRSVNSYIRQAKALFSKRIRNLCKANGIQLPDLADFLDSDGYSGVKVRYQLPNDALIRKTFEYLADPDKAPPRDVYVAILLALFADARKSEVIKARPVWLTESHDQPGIDLKETKNGLPRFIPLPLQVFLWLRESTPATNTYFIEGTKTYRTADVYKAANAWLRALGWDRGKPFHELRKLYGSMIATTQGLEKAKDLLDHESIRTTEEHYAKTTMGQGIVALWEGFFRSSK